MNPIKIALIEDDDDDAFLMSDWLNHEPDFRVELHRFSNAQEGLNALLSSSWDLALVDHLLGAQTGVELIEQVRKQNNQLPIILMTGVGNRQIDLQAIQKGADDYLPKTDLSTEILHRTIRHVFERRKQREQIENERTKFQKLFDQAFDPCFLCDSNRVVLEENSAFKQFIGTSASGTSIEHWFDGAEHIEAFLTQLRLHQAAQIETSFRANRETKVGVIRMRKIDDQSSGESFFLGSIHDLTELRKTQQILADTEKINLTGRMIRNIGHDIRNPLSNILMATEHLEHELTDPKDDSKELLHLIKRNGKRINDLLTTMLNNTRGPEILWEELDLETVVHEAIEWNNDRLALFKVNLTCKGLEGSSRRPVMRQRLRIAIGNLISNAIDAVATRDQPNISVSFANDGEYYVIEIADNGIGMAPETAQQIFTPFFTGRSGGLGLGLSACKQYLDEHHASISVSSQLNQGTTFTVKIPANGGPDHP